MDDAHQAAATKNSPHESALFAALVAARAQGVARPPIDIDMRGGGNGANFTFGGWSYPEPQGTWTQGDSARLLIALWPDDGRDVQVAIDLAMVFLTADHPRLEVDIGTDDGWITTWRFKHGLGLLPSFHPPPIHVARKTAPFGIAILRIRIRGARAPRDLGVSGDSRRLGICISSISIKQADDDA